MYTHHAYQVLNAKGKNAESTVYKMLYKKVKNFYLYLNNSCKQRSVCKMQNQSVTNTNPVLTANFLHFISHVTLTKIAFLKQTKTILAGTVASFKLVSFVLHCLKVPVVHELEDYMICCTVH